MANVSRRATRGKGSRMASCANRSSVVGVGGGSCHVLLGLPSAGLQDPVDACAHTAGQPTRLHSHATCSLGLRIR